MTLLDRAVLTFEERLIQFLPSLDLGRGATSPTLGSAGSTCTRSSNFWIKSHSHRKSSGRERSLPRSISACAVSEPLSNARTTARYICGTLRSNRPFAQIGLVLKSACAQIGPHRPRTEALPRPPEERPSSSGTPHLATGPSRRQ